MPVFSRTVVTAEEILRGIPANEDDMYTSWGVLKVSAQEFLRCQARKGKPDHCPREAKGSYCSGHEMRLRKPPASFPWDAPIKSTRGRPKGGVYRVRADGADAAQTSEVAA